MKRETLKKANDLDEKRSIVQTTVKQIQTKLESVGVGDNWGFDNVRISSTPMGVIQVPVDLAEKYLKEILMWSKIEINRLSDELNNLQDEKINIK